MIPKIPAIAAPKPTTAAEGRDPAASALVGLAVWAPARVASDEDSVVVFIVRVLVAETSED